MPERALPDAGIGQPDFFPEAGAIRTVVISKLADFDALFDGFTAMRAVSYVVSPELLLGLFERGFVRIEVLIGENLTDVYRRQLAEKGAELAEQLAGRVASGVLRILVPERTIHSKLYLLEGPTCSRVILTSANLTATARYAASQLNYAWYLDLQPGDAWLARVERDYSAHLRRASLFMGDLAELLQEQRDVSRREVVEAWLRGVAAEDVDQEARKLLQELAARCLQEGSEGLLTLKLPDAPAALRRVEKLLAPFGASASEGELRVQGAGFLRHVQNMQGLPLLRVDVGRREMRMAIDGIVERLDEAAPAAGVVNLHLERLEGYFESVNQGRSPDPQLAKMSMLEALLAIWSAPFAHEFMRLKRRAYGAIDSRGPRSLYIFGPSQNGKSTFLKYALRLIAGRRIEPLSGAEFGKRKVLASASIGTGFPLVFDDLVLASRYGVFEEVLKSYWEAWWREDCVSPQLALSSNAHSLPPWAKSRLKRLDFDVHFTPSPQGREALARAFTEDNHSFRWFASLYLERLAAGGAPPEDESGWAREALSSLYRHAGRTLPPYFPATPIEGLYDPGRNAWLELLERIAKARIDWDSERAFVHFAEDMQFYEIKEYEGQLPAHIKQRRRGKTLIIDNPHELRVWLGVRPAGGALKRLGRWLAGT